MTLQQYITQQHPRRNLRVQVRPEELTTLFNVPGGRLAGLNVAGSYYQYFIPDGGIMFWTMDKDGNPDRLSVFELTT